MGFEFEGMELDSRQPIYMQVIKYFKVHIHLGNLRDGDEIPSRRIMAAMANINPATVQKAYKQMEDEGLIITLNNSKSIISVDDEALKKISKELTENHVRDFLKAVKMINLSFKDVIDLISRLWHDI